MKANAPEKLYVDVQDNLDDSFLYGFIEKRTDEDIEYTRTEAFIDKACEWLESINLDWYQIREGVFSKQLVEDFKQFMKGE